jgi:hypothetical protein
MNERIRELVAQSTTIEVLSGRGFDETQYTERFNKEKFAEMIVKECASICEINGQTYKYSFTPAKARLAESTSNHCAMMINKHFGVEE